METQAIMHAIKQRQRIGRRGFHHLTPDGNPCFTCARLTQGMTVQTLVQAVEANNWLPLCMTWKHTS